jgi:GAF domain-containing protein
MGQASDPLGTRFAHVARLELDELLEQLVARARDVQETQGRLRSLLRAYLAVARADDLDSVLQHIVEAAGELVNATYAALGEVSSGKLVRFVHTGMDPETVARIGRLPEGKGLLGLLVDYPQSLRLRNIADHVASVGFPDHHPPMTSFLGVPIQVGDRVFGNLYLTEKRDGGQFTADDEELAQALAAAAAAAIENATLLAESRRRHKWQTAMMEISTGLLAGDDPTEALRQLVHHAREILDAAGAGVNLPVPDGPDGPEWRVAVTEGTFDRWVGRRIPLEGSVTGAAIAAGDLVLVPDPSTDAHTAATAGDEVIGLVGETLAVPLRGERGTTGVLVASRPPGDGGFDRLDREMMCAIAAHAGLALELAEVRRDNERLHLVEDREQIAVDLRDRAMQRLSAHALALQAAASRTVRPEVRQALERQVAEADEIIRDIRAAVFSLDPGPRPHLAPADG